MANIEVDLVREGKAGAGLNGLIHRQFPGRTVGVLKSKRLNSEYKLLVCDLLSRAVSPSTELGAIVEETGSPLADATSGDSAMVDDVNLVLGKILDNLEHSVMACVREINQSYPFPPPSPAELDLLDVALILTVSNFGLAREFGKKFLMTEIYGNVASLRCNSKAKAKTRVSKKSKKLTADGEEGTDLSGHLSRRKKEI